MFGATEMVAINDTNTVSRQGFGRQKALQTGANENGEGGFLLKTVESVGVY